MQAITPAGIVCMGVYSRDGCFFGNRFAIRQLSSFTIAERSHRGREVRHADTGKGTKKQPDGEMQSGVSWCIVCCDGDLFCGTLSGGFYCDRDEHVAVFASWQRSGSIKELCCGGLEKGGCGSGADAGRIVSAAPGQPVGRDLDRNHRRWQLVPGWAVSKKLCQGKSVQPDPKGQAHCL